MTIVTLIAGWLHLAGCFVACQSGVVGNFAIEVGPTLDPCTVSRSGVGLPQLAGVLRRRYLASAGADWCSPRRQVEFVIEVLTETGLRDRLFRETDPGRAAALFAREFERPKSTNYAGRVRLAREFYRDLMGSTSLAGEQQ